MRQFKIDTERKTIWDLSQGKIYNIYRENDFYIGIVEPKVGIGLFDKQKENIIIPPIYDWIAEPYKGIPNNRRLPFIISKNNRHGIALPNGTIAIDTIINYEEYVVYPDTYGEGFVAASQYKENICIGDPLCFLNNKGEQCTDFIYTAIRQPFKGGKAIVTIGNNIIELDHDFNVIDSYCGVYYGFNDEKYYI